MSYPWPFGPPPQDENRQAVGWTTARDGGFHRSGLSRRGFVQSAGLAGLGVLAGCGRLAGPAQPPPKVARVGYLGNGPSSVDEPELDAFRDGLGRLGWVGGRNLELETRFTERQPHRTAELA